MKASEKHENYVSEHEDGDSVELWDLFTRLVKMWGRNIEREMGSSSIKPVEIKILHVLEEKGEIPVALIADRIGVTSPWVTASVNRLVTRGLVQKVKSQSDKRITRISMTPEGKEYLEKVRSYYSSTIRNIFDSLTEAEKKSLTRVLLKIEESLRSQM
ncbi:MAG: MarR family transcriptional regulator [Thermoplasmataceae archaeon]